MCGGLVGTGLLWWMPTGLACRYVRGNYAAVGVGLGPCGKMCKKRIQPSDPSPSILGRHGSSLFLVSPDSAWILAHAPPPAQGLSCLIHSVGNRLWCCSTSSPSVRCMLHTTYYNLAASAHHGMPCPFYVMFSPVYTFCIFIPPLSPRQFRRHKHPLADEPQWTARRCWCRPVPLIPPDAIHAAPGLLPLNPSNFSGGSPHCFFPQTNHHGPPTIVVRKRGTHEPVCWLDFL